MNRALWNSLSRESHRAVGDDVASVWSRTLRDPGRFQVFDTAALVAVGSRMSDEFRDRYGHLAVTAAPD